MLILIQRSNTAIDWPLLPSYVSRAVNDLTMVVRADDLYGGIDVTPGLTVTICDADSLPAAVADLVKGLIKELRLSDA